MTHEFDNLPALTTVEANVVGAMLSPHASVHDVAAALDLPLGRLFDLLASPNVKAHLANARQALEHRVRLRIADAAHKAVDTLEHIAESQAPQGRTDMPAELGPDATWQTERRRAATTLLRAFTQPRRAGHRRSLNVNRINRLVDQFQSPTDRHAGAPPAPAAATTPTSSRPQPISRPLEPDSTSGPRDEPPRTRPRPNQNAP